MGIHAGDVSLFNGAREGLQPAFRTPYIRIGTPQGRIGVRSDDAGDNFRALRDRNRVDHSSIPHTNRFREREDSVLRRAATKCHVRKQRGSHSRDDLHAEETRHSRVSGEKRGQSRDHELPVHALRLHPKSFTADSLQVRKLHDLVEVERVAITVVLYGLDHFLTKLVLDIWVVS